MSFTDPFATEVQLLTENLRAAINDPADQIRIMVEMAGFSPSGTPDTATASLCRRSALASLARATAAYVPISKQEVASLLETIVPLYDAEAAAAADAGDMQSYAQVRELRAAVVADLRARGFDLPELLTITQQTSLPSLAIAWSLYADADREQELVGRNAVMHPLFMPLTIQALSS